MSDAQPTGTRRCLRRRCERWLGTEGDLLQQRNVIRKAAFALVMLLKEIDPKSDAADVRKIISAT